MPMDKHTYVLTLFWQYLNAPESQAHGLGHLAAPQLDVPQHEHTPCFVHAHTGDVMAWNWSWQGSTNYTCPTCKCITRSVLLTELSCLVQRIATYNTVAIPHCPSVTAQPSPAQPSPAQPSTAQHSTAQHSTAQHSTAQPSPAQPSTSGNDSIAQGSLML